MYKSKLYYRQQFNSYLFCYKITSNIILYKKLKKQKSQFTIFPKEPCIADVLIYQLLI